MILALIAILPSCSNTNEEIEGLFFYLLEDGTYCVTGYEADDLETITIPSTYNGKAVTKIDEHAFAELKDLKTVNIPDSIKIIGAHAFENCDSIENTYDCKYIHKKHLYSPRRRVHR